MKRSMTRTRSIGARSDYSAKTNGDTEVGEDEADEVFANGKPERTWSIYKEDGSQGRGPPPTEDPEDPINKYVQDQLARIKSNESAEMAEELASQNDGVNEKDM